MFALKQLSILINSLSEYYEEKIKKNMQKKTKREGVKNSGVENKFLRLCGDNYRYKIKKKSQYFLFHHFGVGFHLLRHQWSLKRVPMLAHCCE